VTLNFEICNGQNVNINKKRSQLTTSFLILTFIQCYHIASSALDFLDCN
jgi:hypothetical protein